MNWGHDRVQCYLGDQKEIWYLVKFHDMGIPICLAKANTFLNVINVIEENIGMKKYTENKTPYISLCGENRTLIAGRNRRWGNSVF